MPRCYICRRSSHLCLCNLHGWITVQAVFVIIVIKNANCSRRNISSFTKGSTSNLNHFSSLMSVVKVGMNLTGICSGSGLSGLYSQLSYNFLLFSKYFIFYILKSGGILCLTFPYVQFLN